MKTVEYQVHPNFVLIGMILSRIPDIKVIDEGNRYVIHHKTEDWDMITILAKRLSLVAERWMENKEPRTTIYTG